MEEIGEGVEKEESNLIIWDLRKVLMGGGGEDIKDGENEEGERRRERERGRVEEKEKG